MQLLLQPHTGAVAVAVHAQLLPLQVSIPAVDALTTAISAVFGDQPSEEGEARKNVRERQQAGQQGPAGRAAPIRPPAPSPAQVAAAATVIIEDASATLDPHRRRAAASLACTGAELERSGSSAAAAGSGSQLQQQQQHGADDLSGALFTFVHSSSSSRPAPLHVQAFSGGGGNDAGGDNVGLGSRLGARLFGRAQPAQGGEQGPRRHGIRFCYPHPRAVVLLAVEVRVS